MKCVYSGNFNGDHFKKRRLTGAEKERALNALLSQRMDPSIYTRNQANFLMKEGNYDSILL